MSLHDGHALVTESIVKMGLVAWTEFVNAQLLDRTLGEAADAGARKNCFIRSPLEKDFCSDFKITQWNAGREGASEGSRKNLDFTHLASRDLSVIAFSSNDGLHSRGAALYDLNFRR
jgi:hypothetical protein